MTHTKTIPYPYILLTLRQPQVRPIDTLWNGLLWAGALAVSLALYYLLAVLVLSL